MKSESKALVFDERLAKIEFIDDDLRCLPRTNERAGDNELYPQIQIGYCLGFPRDALLSVRGQRPIVVGSLPRFTVSGGTVTEKVEHHTSEIISLGFGCAARDASNESAS